MRSAARVQASQHHDQPSPGQRAATGQVAPDEGETVLLYRDEVEGFAGWLAFHGHGHRLAAGGFRVQPGLTGAKVAALARAMTGKQRLLGLAVDGAKCGIAYRPSAPGRREAMRRFLRFLRPYLLERFSMGPDMGTRWEEIEALARQEDIPSVKIAIARAQGLSQPEVLRRLRLLDVRVGGLTLAQRRAGHGLAHAALAALSWAGCRTDGQRVAIQGFGTLGRAAAVALSEAGSRVVAVADEHGALLADEALPVPALVTRPHGTPVAAGGQTGATAAPRDALYAWPVDLLVLAACEDAMSLEQAGALPAGLRVVAVGANLGLRPDVEESLRRRGVVVVPDIVGGCGGSASMDALFGSPTCPSPERFLRRLGARTAGTADQVLEIAAGCNISPRQAAMFLCEERGRAKRAGHGSLRPYGLP